MVVGVDKMVSFVSGTDFFELLLPGFAVDGGWFGSPETFDVPGDVLFHAREVQESVTELAEAASTFSLGPVTVHGLTMIG